jgi:molecular chaperone HscB
MEHAISCWNCGKGVAEIHFCDSCHSLQPPASNYFDFFGLPHRLDLNLKELESRFYTLSRRLHPDVYFRRSAQERQFSLDSTAILNDAYRTLRDPVSRAEYLLKENGFDIGEQKSANVPPELLEEVFELNMALEELRSGDDDARPQLEEAQRNFAGMQAEIDEELREAFAEYDRDLSLDVLARVRSILNRRKYIRNLVAQVDKELAAAV